MSGVKTITKKTILIFGNGYVSSFLTNKLDKLGWTIYCTSRKVDHKNPIKKANLTIINFFSKSLPSIIASSDVILSTVPPEKEGIDPVLKLYGPVICMHKFNWIGYLSSTSVYGDHGGHWVDEATKCEPSHEKSIRRLFIENQWLDLYFQYDLPVSVLRLSGIYGPYRNCLEDIIKGKDFTPIKENQYFSRIHIDDICNSIIHAMGKPTPCEVYNLSDNEPSLIHLVHQYGAQILERGALRETPIEDLILSDQAKFFFQDNKKVRNKKIVQAFNIRWIYPTYHSGLLKGCLPYL